MTSGQITGLHPGREESPSGRAGRQLVVFCRCAHYDIIPRASREQVLNSLSEAGVWLEPVDDLCGWAAGRDLRLQNWAQAAALAIVACYPRAVRWLFHAAGAPLPNGPTRFFNLRTQPPAEIIRELMKDDGSLMIEEKLSASAAATNHQSPIINDQSGWVPWFPVIDYDRCQSCKQCLNFCLFGVYAQSAQGRVEVRNPAGCKTNCPACARMCPQQAIIFPKYGESPINGEEVPLMAADAGSGANPQSAIRHPQSSDLYDKIRRRGGQKRFSTDRQEASAARSCPTLDSLRKELGIPDDVLSALSPAELARIHGKSPPGGRAERQGGGDDEAGGRKKGRHG